MQKISKETNIKSQTHKKQMIQMVHPIRVYSQARTVNKLHQWYQFFFPLPENPPKSTHKHKAWNKYSFNSIDLPQSPQQLISKTRPEQ